MLLGAEIALLFCGIVTFIKGKASISQTRAVYGTPARVLSLLLMAPAPLSFGVCFVVGFVTGASGMVRDIRPNVWVFALIEAAILVLCIFLFYAIGRTLAEPVRSESPYRDETLRIRPLE